MEWTQALESVCLASEALKSDSFLDLNYEILTVEPQRNGTNSSLIQVDKTFCRYQQVCFIGTVDGKVQKPIVELSAYWMIARVESMQQGHKGQMDTEYNEAE